MHAPLEVTWSPRSKVPVFIGDEGEYGDSSFDSVQTVLIEAKDRVLIASGDLDMCVLTDGTLLSIQNMNWNGEMGFQEPPSTPIVITLPDLQYQDVFEANGYGEVDGSQGTMELQHFERGLMFARTYLSGYMGLQFQP